MDAFPTLITPSQLLDHRRVEETSSLNAAVSELYALRTGQLLLLLLFSRACSDVKL